MNNRFKFRVWDKAENKYNGFSFHLAMSGELDRLSVDGDLLETDPNRFTVEQSTGIADKNGKLIFEGDVVRCDIDFVPDGRVDLIRTVIFKDGAFQLSSKDGGFYFIMGFHNIEIIGTIHDDQFREVTKMVEGEQC